jgi:hypothetical protein
MVSEGSSEQLVMFRVPRLGLLDRASYEFFAGSEKRGTARWSPDINACTAVCTFPQGWSCSSVVHNAPLGLYLMSAGCLESIDDLDDTVGPARLGFWTADHPWGPWEQIYEESPWKPGGTGTYICGPHISPKWIAEDGKSFWMTWTDWTKTSAVPAEYLMDLWFAPNDRASRVMDHQSFLAHRNFRFNRQRVDLVTG